MKKTLLLFVLTLFYFSALHPQSAGEVIEEAHKLMAQKKYLTAFDTLDKRDPLNQNPDIVLLKEKIVLDYFIVSIMHQLFALKDLKPGETIPELRGKTNMVANMFLFPVDSILFPLIKKYPGNYKLHDGLGKYYFEVVEKYGDNWLKPTDTLIFLTRKYLKTALEHGAGDYRSQYILGYLDLIQNKTQKAIPQIRKSLSMNDENPHAHYNLAYAYFVTGKKDSAAVEALKAAAQYTDSIYKADAYRLAGIAYSDLKQYPQALKNLLESDKYDPNNFYTLQELLKIYVIKNDPKQKELRKKIFLLDPANPTVYDALNRIYQDTGQTDDLIRFYKEQTQDFQNNDEVMAGLYFYLGYLHLEKDRKQAVEYFKKARKIFERILPPGHEVFQVIDNVLNK